MTGVSDAVFCHTGRFIAGTGSLERIKELAQIAINEPYEHESIINKVIKIARKLFGKK
ncbi:MYG1 family protein [Clostridium sediminicola]|uniref:MYG1 family protein n=1 Tax=Clostridium sediminicola TaxID=3114879 RepID=UPI003D162CD3